MFTSVEVAFGVVIRRARWAIRSIVKIRSTESEVERLFCLKLRRLWSKENYIVGVRSSNERINQSYCLIPGFVIGWFFRFCIRLQQSSFDEIISDGVGVLNGIGRNETFWFFRLTFRHRSWFPFSISLAASFLTSPTTIPTPTPSLVKTSLTRSYIC